MSILKYKTRDNSDPKGKPRVYFTCHPEDFKLFFPRICTDIFRTHDCAIYYNPDLLDSRSADDMELDIGNCNLVVIPVTYKLLSTPNRAMDDEVMFAKKEHIPILPIVVETGLDAIYSSPNKFGELQYLDIANTDPTAISYDEKLDRFLSSVLITGELVDRIRSAFDAYIFLSYRKKDRKYANELMRLIHSNPECRDIAVWFDEFLTPGESFKDNIKKILQNSTLFTLLVTPNILEEPDGKPNYVMGEEYPAAREMGIRILPAEMIETDKQKLVEKYNDIPPCVNALDSSLFREHFLESLTHIAKTENNDNAMHNLLIGLAYMDGIDVEVNRSLGLKLISAAGEAGLPEAMIVLYNIYDTGKGASIDYHLAAFWIQRLFEYRKAILGEKSKDTIDAQILLIRAFIKAGEYVNAVEVGQRAYGLCCDIFGKRHEITVNIQNDIATVKFHLGKYQEARDSFSEISSIWRETLGEKHQKTLAALTNLSITYDLLGSHQDALELNKKVYYLYCEVYGEKAQETLLPLSNLALCYSNVGDLEKSKVLLNDIYELRCEIFGEHHPSTLFTLSNLAEVYSEMGENQRALEIEERIFPYFEKIWGENHLFTLTLLSNLACSYEGLHNGKKARELHQKAYSLCSQHLDDGHPQRITAIRNLSRILYYVDENVKAFELLNKEYNHLIKTLGGAHSCTLPLLKDMTFMYSRMGGTKTVFDLWTEAYQIRNDQLGKEHPDTLISLSELSKAKEKWEALQLRYRKEKLCQHCGRPFSGLFRKKCSNCGKPKDY